MKKSLLIIGGGGREHALGWKLKQSPKVEKIYFAPGNAGTSELGENVDIKATDILALADFAEKNKIDFTVVGPDDSLALGVVDKFKKRGLKIWGPSQAAAQIESSKAFAKKLMQENNIPTAEFKTLTDYDEALRYVKKHFSSVGAGLGRPFPDSGRLKAAPTGTTSPIVIKASGLALGKGVAVCKTLAEAKQFLQDVMVKKIFGDSGSTVVIEEFLQGMEFSVHAFSDGKSYKIFPPAQDHKTIYDGDQGPNTGGMGTVAPLPWMTGPIMDDISMEIVRPALKGLKKLGSPFAGLLYPGVMMTKNGPKVIEFNSRFGDPECQSYMRLLKTDLLDILEACVDGKLADISIEWDTKYACCIVLASGGYPGHYERGLPITGVDEASKLEDIFIFHAGTKLASIPSPLEGRVREGLVTNGGRVLGVTSVADDLQEALNKAYAAIKLINFEGIHYRKDIGQKSLTTINH